MALLAGGLVFPWFQVSLEPTRSAWSLPVLVTGLAQQRAFSYGVAALASLALAGFALVRSGGRPSAWLAAAGFVAVFTAGYFALQGAVSDRALTTDLTNQQAELNSIVGQLGYSIPRNQLSAVLFVPLSGTWQQVASGLRPGWYLTALGGALLVASGFPLLLAALRSRPRAAAAIVAVVLLGLAATVGRGVVAEAMVDSANTTLQSGDYSSAMSQLDVADALNPEVRFDPRYALARGQALTLTGDRSSALALLYQAQLRNSVHDEVGALALMEDAADRDPGDPVVIATTLDQARRMARRRQNPSVLLGVVAKHWGDHVAERYMLGRILYAAGDFANARTQLVTAAAEAAADSNVASAAYTYVALCDIRLGDADSARQELLRAIHLDHEYLNSLARTLATGLYVSGTV